MNRTKEEYLALLENTINYYSEDISRRATPVHGNSCMYLTEDGKNCAVGRFLVEDFDYEHLNSCTSVEDLYRDHYEGTDSFLLPEYRGYDVEFWTALQNLHDGNYNWDEKGLTDKGKQKVEVIKKAINIDVFSCLNH